MKAMKNYKNIIEYAACVILAFVFAYYLYGRGGVLIATVMIVGAVISIALDLYVKNKVSIDIISGDVSYFSKSELCSIDIEIRKSTRLPTPFIEITLDTSDNLEQGGGGQLIRLCLVNRRVERVTASLKAVGCGGGYIGIREARLCDYLGFLRLKLTTPEKRAVIGVLPDMIEIVPDRELLKSAVDTSGEEEDEERESQDTSLFFNGTAGYEHRAYIAGDPLKKINWKLSSKRGELLVRLDEALVSSSRVFVLDLAKEGFGAASRDRIIQSCFAVCMSVLRSGYECELYFYDGEPQHFKLTPSDDPQSVQTALSLAVPSSGGIDVYDDELLRGGRGATVFTDERRREYFSFIVGKAAGGSVAFITTDVGLAYVSNMWSVDSELVFTKL